MSADNKAFSTDFRNCEVLRNSDRPANGSSLPWKEGSDGVGLVVGLAVVVVGLRVVVLVVGLLVGFAVLVVGLLVGVVGLVGFGPRGVLGVGLVVLLGVGRAVVVGLVPMVGVVVGIPS